MTGMEENIMMNIEFITGETFISSWCSGSAEYTPVYALLNGTKRLVRNISHTLTGDSYVWMQYSDKKSIEEVEAAKKNLMEHDGRYITFHALYDNPFDFLNWVKENNYTLEVVQEFFAKSENGEFTDFHGNTCEYSCSFHYRVYDETMLEELKVVVSSIKQYIR